jgi:hypothetical protein
MRRTTMGLLVLAVVMTLIAAGCGSSGRNRSAGAPSSAASATTTTPPATASTTTKAAPTTGSAAAARCSNAVLLRAAQKALRESGSTVTITSITLTRCRNGYALLSAHPASNVNAESPNVFLVWRPAAGAWEALDFGTGIDCAGSPIGPKLTAACKALGYPVRG